MVRKQSKSLLIHSIFLSVSFPPCFSLFFFYTFASFHTHKEIRTRQKSIITKATVCHANAITKVFTAICFVCMSNGNSSKSSRRCWSNVPPRNIFNFMKNFLSDISGRNCAQPNDRTLEIVKYFDLFSQFPFNGFFFSSSFPSLWSVCVYALV